MPSVLPSQWTTATFAAHDTLLVGGNTWDPMSANQTYSLVGVTQNGDNQACRFEVRQGDYAIDAGTGAPIGGDSGVKNRSEISGYGYQGNFSSNPTGHIYVNYDFVLSTSCPTNDANWFAFGQFHQVNNDGNSPPFEIDLYYNSTGSAGPIGPTDCQAIGIGTGTTNSGITYTTLYHDPLNSPLVRGRLYTMSIDINFDNSSNGSVHITRDDHQGGGPVTLVNYTGPVGWGSTMQGVYWKHGIYRAASSSTQIITYSNHTISQTPPSGGGGGGAMTYIAPSAWVSGTTNASTTGILYHANKYAVENANKTYSVSSTDDNTIRFEVRSGDSWPGDGTTTKERSELDGDASGDGTIFPQSQPIIVIYDIMIEAGTVNQEPTSGFGPVIGQFHHDNQTGGWSPPYECDLGNNDFMNITINNAGNNANSWSNYPTIWTDNVAVVRGNWYHFHIEVMFDPVNGYLKVWKDHQLIVNYSGALGWSTMGNVYWKFGLYRGAVSYTTAANYKNLFVSIPLAINSTRGRLGSTKLKGVITGGASLTRLINGRTIAKSALKCAMSLKTRLTGKSTSSSTSGRARFFMKLPPVFLQASGFFRSITRMFQAALVIPSQFQPQQPPPPLTWNYTLTYNPREATKFKTFAYAHNFAIAHGLQDTCLILHTTQNNYINPRKGQKPQDVYLIYDEKKREFYANITPKPDGTY